MDQDGLNGFFLACIYNRVEVAKYLYLIGKEKFKIKKDGLRNVLRYTAMKGHVKTIKFLISIGFDPHAITEGGQNLATLACYSGNMELIEYILEIGVNIYHKTKDGKNIFNQFFILFYLKFQNCASHAFLSDPPPPKDNSIKVIPNIFCHMISK